MDWDTSTNSAGEMGWDTNTYLAREMGWDTNTNLAWKWVEILTQI